MDCHEPVCMGCRQYQRVVPNLLFVFSHSERNADGFSSCHAACHLVLVVLCCVKALFPLVVLSSALLSCPYGFIRCFLAICPRSLGRNEQNTAFWQPEFYLCWVRPVWIGNTGVSVQGVQAAW